MFARPPSNTVVDQQKHVRWFYSAWTKWCKGVNIKIGSFYPTNEEKLPPFDQWKVFATPYEADVEEEEAIKVT